MKKLGWLILFVASALMAQTPGQSYMGCQLYPSDSVFHLRVDSLPVSTNPAAQIPSADLTYFLHPIFGQTAGNGFLINVVPSTQAMVAVTGTAANSNQYWQAAPIPSNAILEGAGAGCTGTSPSSDCHLLVLQQAATSGGTCTAYEAYGAAPGMTAGTWNVNGEFPVENLAKYAMPPLDNGAPLNASQVPLLPTLITSADLSVGVIAHVIAITVPNPPAMYQNFLWPAAAFGGAGGKCTGGYEDANSMVLDGTYEPTSCPSTSGPAAGTVYRLKASATLPTCIAGGTCPQTAMIVKALQQYGAIVVDNGSAFFGLLGEQNSAWSDTDLANLKLISVGDMEPVAVSLEAATLSAPIGNGSILAPVTTYQVNAPASGSTVVTLTVAYGGVTKTASVTISGSPTPGTPTLNSVTVSPTSVASGGTVTVTVTLTAAAPSAGAVVSLATSDSTHFPVPATLTIPSGQTSGSFTVTAQ